ncbi:hypothetical protein [Herbaspirillum sp. alder98]|uniref:hypothetical protein n=1 Tax=Herbaspirillum sp. alder98 TaxID=2913096 RepID=UPI001CD8974D|nr:hypothetical protein [Herbaspirillum sp. alder98]MCA1323948.1 hypothetical protein [Herbaspirillum sp. alder98]
MSITLAQLCWAALGPYWEHPATVVHAEHHEVATKPAGDVAAKLASGFCSSCEMAAASLGYPGRISHRFARARTPAPTGLSLAFSSHIPEHPDEPDWRAAS